MRLRSGGPWMTVQHQVVPSESIVGDFRATGLLWMCAWFVGDEVSTETFWDAGLVVVDTADIPATGLPDQRGKVPAVEPA